MAIAFPTFMDIIGLIVWVILLLISAIPLHLAVWILGGKSSVLKALFVNLIIGLLTAVLFAVLGVFGKIVAILVLILTIWIYREAFRLKWWKALVVWLIQMVIFWLMSIVLGFFGIGLINLKQLFTGLF